MTNRFKIKLDVTERELRLIGQALGARAETFGRIAEREAIRLTDLDGVSAETWNVASGNRDFLGALGVSLEQLADSEHTIGARFKGGFLK